MKEGGLYRINDAPSRQRMVTERFRLSEQSLRKRRS